MSRGTAFSDRLVTLLEMVSSWQPVSVATSIQSLGRVMFLLKRLEEDVNRARRTRLSFVI